jgi:hypothetical protein
MYKINWRAIDLEQDIDESGYVFVAAENEFEAGKEFNEMEYTIREASYEEAEAYVAGYEDGYDNAIVADRLNGMNIDLDQLTEVEFDKLFPPVEEEDENNG